MHDSHREHHEPSREDIEHGYERADLNTKAIVTFMAILTVMLLLTGVTMLGLYFVLGKQNLQSEPPPSPLALERQLPPEPRLQALPSVDLKQLRERDAVTLNNYGWVSREAKVVRLPVERAMQLVAERGLPLFPVTPPAELQPGASSGVPAAPAAPAISPSPSPAPEAAQAPQGGAS